MDFSISKLLMAVAMTTASTFMAAADNSYLNRSSWTWSASSSDTQDGGGVNALHDDDYSTFWHSNYHEESSHNCPHWIMIDRGSDKNTFQGISYVPRQGAYNNIVTEFRVYLSNTAFGNITSVDTSALGYPDYSGSFDGSGDYSERTFSFGKDRSERYVLFIIDNCNSGRSTAVAEFYLLSKTDGSGTGSGGSNHNAVLIHNTDGSDHRIAIDGEALNVTLNGRMVHMTNSGITIEYDIPEVQHFAFETYQFPEDTYYIGNKQDLNSQPQPDPEPFDLIVTPADGTEVEDSLLSISFAHPFGLETEVTGNDAIVLARGILPIRRWTCTQLSELYDPETRTYTLSDINCTVTGTYTLTIPSTIIVEKENPVNYNNQLTANITLKKGESSITDTDATSTLGFRVADRRLLINGINAGSTATLFTITGIEAASAKVTPFGTATIDLSGLSSGAYVLHVDGKSFKITI